MEYDRRRRRRTGKIALKPKLARVSVSGIVTARPNRNVTGRATLDSRKDAMSAAGARSAPKRTGTSTLRMKPAQVQASGTMATKPTGTEFSAEFSSEFGKSNSTPGVVSGTATLRLAAARELAAGTVTSQQTGRSFTTEFAVEFA